MRRVSYFWVAAVLTVSSAGRAQPADSARPRPEATKAEARPGETAKPRPEAAARPRPEGSSAGKTASGPVAKVRGESEKDKPAAKPKVKAKPVEKKLDAPPPIRLRRFRPYRKWRKYGRGKRSPFTIRRGPWSLTVKGQLQVQAVAFVGKDALYENYDPASDEGVLIRRARLGIEGTLPWHFKYSLMIEAFGDLQRGSRGEGLAGESKGAQLLDANITWARYRMLNIGVGSDKVPGAKGRMVESRLLQLVERPFVVEQFAVDRRAGAWVKGDFKYFNYHIGFFNGDTGLSFGNEGGGYLVGARLEVTPLGIMAPGRPDALKKSRRAYRKPRLSAGVSFQFQHGPAVDRMAISGDVAFKWHGLSVAGEVMYVREDPLEEPTVPPVLPELNEGLGWYLQAGYFVLPGRLEVAARFEYLEPNYEIRDARDIWAVTGGINYHWTKYIRAQLSYTHKEERNNAPVENDSFLLQMQVAF